MTVRTILINEEIVPKGRPRFSTVGKFPKVYTDKKTRDFENRVAEVAKSYIQEPLKGALAVRITIYKKIPKSWTKSKKEKAEQGLLAVTTKPDIDNYAKSILDGMNGVAFEDDSQIVQLTLEKRFAKEGYAKVHLKTLDAESAY